jgi:DNA-binding response OmpR family regulator
VKFWPCLSDKSIKDSLLHADDLIRRLTLALDFIIMQFNMAQTYKNDKNTILVIEKDAHTAYLLDYMLSREGFKVISTTSCESASHMMRQMIAPAVIFLDMELSSLNNYAMLHSIRSIPGWHITPVLLLAEYYAIKDVDIALEAGATDYIVQPFNPVELLFQIYRHLL